MEAFVVVVVAVGCRVGGCKGDGDDDAREGEGEASASTPAL